MATRTAHRLSGGLVVSAPPERRTKERLATSSTATAPYTGGDLDRSGDLGRMFIGGDSSGGGGGGGTQSPSVSTPTAQTPGSRPHSGPFSRPHQALKSSSSSFSGPLQIPATGLITSGGTGPPSGSSSARRSGAGDGTPRAPGRTTSSKKKKNQQHGSAVTTVGGGAAAGYEFAISTAAVVAGGLVLVLLLTLGVFLLFAVKSAVVLLAACGMCVVVAMGAVWNWAAKDAGLEAFLKSLPDTDLQGARDEQFVKVTGVVTCGSIPLETSYQGTSRCVYASTELYEYRGINGKQANPNHRRMSWGLRHCERHVADFYISENRRGIRALVKAGHGAKVVPFVKPAHKLQINKNNKEMHPTFMEWLEDSNLSYDDRVMRLDEGYIKEGSTATVMGILQRHDNILMIVPPEKPVSTGCIWRRLLLSIRVKGLVLVGTESPGDDVVTV